MARTHARETARIGSEKGGDAQFSPPKDALTPRERAARDYADAIDACRKRGGSSRGAVARRLNRSPQAVDKKCTAAKVWNGGDLYAEPTDVLIEMHARIGEEIARRTRKRTRASLQQVMGQLEDEAARLRLEYSASVDDGRVDPEEARRIEVRLNALRERLDEAAELGRHLAIAGGGSPADAMGND